jgi:hypothetical protein
LGLLHTTGGLIFVKVRIAIILFFFISLFTSGPVRGQWVDHFENICGLNEWLDVQVTEGWNIQALESHEISISQPGSFTFMPYTVSWYADWRGPLFYKLVNGDFVLTGKLTVTNREEDDIPGSAYSLGGLMVRNRKPFTNGPAGWMPEQEDYVFLSIGQGSTNHPSCQGCPSPHFEVKSTINSNSTLNLSSIDTNTAEIRLVRLDPFVLVLYRFPGEAWEVHRRYFRDDLEDTVQVGMVTYTDWDKVYTYQNTFHNSHVLNEDLDPDPSNNPNLPFAPDIISRYDYLQWLPTTMPMEFVGLDLTDENQVSDADILEFYGDIIAPPSATSFPVWLGGADQNWTTTANWLVGGLPAANDTVRINSCACPEAHCVLLPLGNTTISGLEVEEGGVVTIPVGATLTINGHLENEGTIIVHGTLIINAAVGIEAINRGTLDCREGGIITIHD